MLKFLFLLILFSSSILMGVEADFMEVSRRCKNQYVYFNDSLRHQEMWAMKSKKSFGLKNSFKSMLAFYSLISV